MASKMEKSVFVRLAAACAATLLSVGSVCASPLVDVQIVGGTTLDVTGNSYTSTVNAAPGQTVYYAVKVEMAPIGTVNGSKTISTLPSGTAGVLSLSYNLTDTGATFDNDAAVQAPFTDAGTSVYSNGTYGATQITNVVGSINVATGDKPQGVGSDSAPALALVQLGSLVAGQSDSQVTGAYGTTTGTFKINNGSPVSGNNVNVTSGDPSGYVSFVPLSIATPEPATLALVGVAGLALVGRCRSKRVVVR